MAGNGFRQSMIPKSFRLFGPDHAVNRQSRVPEELQPFRARSCGQSAKHDPEELQPFRTNSCGNTGRMRTFSASSESETLSPSRVSQFGVPGARFQDGIVWLRDPPMRAASNTSELKHFRPDSPDRLTSAN
jgi:hypothetical protein